MTPVWWNNKRTVYRTIQRPSVFDNLNIVGFPSDCQPVVPSGSRGHNRCHQITSRAGMPVSTAHLFINFAERYSYTIRAARRNPTKKSLFILPQTKTYPATQAAREGGQWVLRIEDVSHGEQDEGGSMGRARGLCSAVSVASEGVSMRSSTDEELQAFLPLPTETVKLERA